LYLSGFRNYSTSSHYPVFLSKDQRTQQLEECNKPLNYSIKFLDPSTIIYEINTSCPVIIVLGESFNPNWIATIDGERLNEHFIANGFANAWLVRRTGSFRVIVRYFPQDLSDLGKLIALMSIIMILVVKLINGKIRMLKKRSLMGFILGFKMLYFIK
jgi:hypothetical protein